MLKEFEKNVWHIFTELPVKREFDIYRKAGIDVEQMLSLHQYFTDNHTLKASVKTEDKLQELKKVWNIQVWSIRSMKSVCLRMA